MTLREFHKNRLLELGSSPKKSLGQNFLINSNVVSEIINSVLKFHPNEILEIGPGTGALTEPLLELKKPYTAFEMDHKFASYWQGRGIKIIESDALEIDWQKLNFSKNTCLVSNLPYQIAARIVVEMSIGPESITHMVLMFQKEVAQRIAAKVSSDDYGFLSVISTLAFDVQKVIDASPSDFYPAPKVTSRVLKFKRRATLEQGFVSFVKSLFVNRRKYLSKQLPEPKSQYMEHLKRLGYSEKVRAEEIKPEHFLELFSIMTGALR